MSDDKKNDLILKAAEKLKAKKKKTSSTVLNDTVSAKKSLIEKATQRIETQSKTANKIPENKIEKVQNPLTKRSQPKRSQPKESQNEKTSNRSAFINLPALSSRGVIDPSGERTLIAEEFRLIKRPLLLKAFEKPKKNVLSQKSDKLNNMIVVTSSEDNEGKSFTAINLAMSMASERDLHVLLIDCDMHANQKAESVMSALGVDADKGFLDMLIDEKCDVSDVILSTNIKNLSLLPVGKVKDVATELFASKRMSEKVKEIAERYSDRIVIIDTPPVLLTSETSVIAMNAGQIVYVVEADRTSKQSIEEGVRRLSFCPSVNIVLNKVKQSFGEIYHLHRYQENKFYSYDQAE